jgi:hypothetical protein
MGSHDCSAHREDSLEDALEFASSFPRGYVTLAREIKLKIEEG